MAKKASLQQIIITYLTKYQLINTYKIRDKIHPILCGIFYFLAHSAEYIGIFFCDMHTKYWIAILPELPITTTNHQPSS